MLYTLHTLKIIQPLKIGSFFVMKSLIWSFDNDFYMFYIGLARETALKMIQDNLILDVISKYTGLSLEGLNVLKEGIE